MAAAGGGGTVHALPQAFPHPPPLPSPNPIAGAVHRFNRPPTVDGCGTGDTCGLATRPLTAAFFLSPPGATADAWWRGADAGRALGYLVAQGRVCFPGAHPCDCCSCVCAHPAAGGRVCSARPLPRRVSVAVASPTSAPADADIWHPAASHNHRAVAWRTSLAAAAPLAVRPGHPSPSRRRRRRPPFPR